MLFPRGSQSPGRTHATDFSSFNKVGLSKEGALCLEKFFDPFHDTPIQLVQMPDGNTRPTIVQEIRSSVGLNSGGMDISISVLPFMSCSPTAVPITYGRRSQAAYAEVNWSGAASLNVTRACSANVIAGSLETTMPAGFIDVQYNGVGAAFYPTGVDTMSVVPVRVPVPNASSNAAGARRLLGLALELHNTTAEIYKQGTITCYRKPVTYSEDAFLVGNLALSSTGVGAAPWGTAATNACGTTPIGFPPLVCEAYLPPANIAAAMAIPGTTQWEAAKGAYSVATMCDASENPLAANSMGYFAYTAGDLSSLPVIGIAQQDAIAVKNVQDVLASTVQPFYQFGHSRGHEFLRTNLNNTGMLITGLSAESTFTLTIKALWEFAPSTLAADQTESLVWLAKQPPRYDPVFMELYQEIARQLPVAVPVGLNPSGEWFQMVTKLAAMAAPRIGTAAKMILKQASSNALAQAAGQWGPPRLRQGSTGRSRSRSAPQSRSSSRASSVRSGKSIVRTVSFTRSQRKALPKKDKRSKR